MSSGEDLNCRSREEPESFGPISVGSPRRETCSARSPSSPSSAVEPYYVSIANNAPKSPPVEPQVALGERKESSDDDDECRNGTDSHSVGASTKKTSNKSKQKRAPSVKIEDSSHRTATERLPPPESDSDECIEITAIFPKTPPRVVHHVDERAKAMERKMELEELRQKNLAKPKGTNWISVAKIRKIYLNFNGRPNDLISSLTTLLFQPLNCVTPLLPQSWQFSSISNARFIDSSDDVSKMPGNTCISIELMKNR